MRRAVESVAAGEWASDGAIGTVTLDYDQRHRRRVSLTTDSGDPFLLDLPRATALRDGDGLRLEDGGYVTVRSAPEALVEITCDTPDDLVRIAWHLGNRHLPTQLLGERILIRDDHVIVEMLQGLGATTKSIHAPFDPEGGAYGGHHHDG